MLDFNRKNRASRAPARPVGRRVIDIMDAHRQLKARTKSGHGPEKPTRWVEALTLFIEGKALADVLGFWAEGVPPMVGASGGESAFLSFLEGFRQTVPALGVVTGQGPFGAVRSERPFQDNCGARRTKNTCPAYDSRFRALRFDILKHFSVTVSACRVRSRTASAMGCSPARQFGDRQGLVVQRRETSSSAVGPAHFTGPRRPAADASNNRHPPGVRPRKPKRREPSVEQQLENRAPPVPSMSETVRLEAQSDLPRVHDHQSNN